jgi:uncharacterized protein (TIGR00725 family)
VSGAAYVAVVGPYDADADAAAAAEECGRLLAEAGAIVVTGGRTGVMEAVSRGAKAAGGTTVGLLPGLDRAEANEFVDVAIATGLGEGRNLLVARAADALIAIAGGYGTLSEIAFALKAGKPVVGIGSWEVDGVVAAGSAADAVERALAGVTR